MLRKWISKEGATSIDVGSHSIKFCQMRCDGTIEEALECPTPQDTVREGTIIDAPAVGAAIKRTIQEIGLKGGAVSLTVGGPAVVARPVKLPSMTNDALAKSIQYEASRYLPTATSEHYVGFDVISRNADQMEALIVAAPREVVQSRLQAARIAGLDPEVVEIEPFALLRSVQLQATDVENPAGLALIDIGASHTQVTVMHGSAFALTRYINIGSEVMSTAIRNYFHYSPEEADEVKRSVNLSELVTPGGVPQENPPLRLLQPIFDELVREIRRSLNYYQSQMADDSGKDARIDRLLLGGGGSLMAGVSDYFHHKLNLPAEILNPFASPAIDASRVTAESQSIGPAYATVVGAAMGASMELATAA